MSQMNIAIIGGGASGLMAALVANTEGANVTIIERNPRIGKKILVTGNGRCNYTNTLTSPDDYNNPSFVQTALQQFPPAKTMHFFDQLGIVPKVEKEGKVYPLSEQASSMVDVFLYEVQKRHIQVVTNAFVTRVIKKRDHFDLYLEDGTALEATKVIIATGGKAMPKTGSDGFGYTLASSLGHTISPVFPSLVKLKLDSPYLKHLEGIKMPANVTLICENQSLQTEVGDVLFGNYGISGPTILQLSRKALTLHNQGKKVYIKVQLLQNMSYQTLQDRFLRDQFKPVKQSLIGLIHKRYISAILKEAKIDKQDTLVKDLTKKQLSRLMELLFDWRFLVKGSKSFHDAQATAGGVSLEEINPQTMESKKIPGLYFTGEVMDIDGRCGGYNLQWAWASGYVAGKHATGGK